MTAKNNRVLNGSDADKLRPVRCSICGQYLGALSSRYSRKLLTTAHKAERCPGYNLRKLL